MLSEWIEKLIELSEKAGYLGVFLSSTGLAPAEVLVISTSASMPGKIIEISLFTMLGQTVGAILTYMIGYFLGEKVFSKIFHGKTNFLNISESSYKKGQKLIKKYGLFYVTLCRFIPGARVISSLVAGLTKQNFFIFLISVITGSFVFGYLFSLIGEKLGNNLEIIKIFADSSYGITILIFLIVAFLLFKYRKGIKKYFQIKKEK